MRKTGSRPIVDLTISEDDEVIDLCDDDTYDDFDGYKGDKTVKNVIAGNPITRRHVEILQDGHWLNDEIINAYLFIVQHSLKSSKIACLNTYFHPKFTKEGISPGVLRWMGKQAAQDLAHLDYLFIPVNLNNTHWALIAYQPARRTLSYLDSMLNRRAGMGLLEKYRPLLEKLHQSPSPIGRSPSPKQSSSGLAAYLAVKLMGSLSLSEPSAKSELTLRIPEGQPQQTDGSSCGVFVCKWVQVLATTTSPNTAAAARFDQTQVTRHRKVILDALLSYKSQS